MQNKTNQGMKKITAIFFCALLGFAGLKIGLSSSDQFTLVPTQTITAGTISSMPFDLQMSRMMKAVRQAVNEEVKTDTVYITEKCNKKPRKIRVPYEVVKHDTVYLSPVDSIPVEDITGPSTRGNRMEQSPDTMPVSIPKSGHIGNTKSERVRDSAEGCCEYCISKWQQLELDFRSGQGH